MGFIPPCRCRCRPAAAGAAAAGRRGHGVTSARGGRRGARSAGAGLRGSASNFGTGWIWLAHAEIPYGQADQNPLLGETKGPFSSTKTCHSSTQIAIPGFTTESGCKTGDFCIAGKPSMLSEKTMLFSRMRSEGFP